MFSIISGILGFATSGLPSLLGFFQQRGDQKHERDMAKLQNEQQMAMAQAGFVSQEKIAAIELDQDLITNPNYTRNTNVITVNSSGSYKIYTQCRISVTSGLSGDAELAVVINNNPYRTYYINNIKQTEISTYNFSCVANLSTGDLVEFHINSPIQPFELFTTSKIYTGVINSYMTIEKLN